MTTVTSVRALLLPFRSYALSDELYPQNSSPAPEIPLLFGEAKAGAFAYDGESLPSRASAFIFNSIRSRSSLSKERLLKSCRR